MNIASGIDKKLYNVGITAQNNCLLVYNRKKSTKYETCAMLLSFQIVYIFCKRCIKIVQAQTFNAVLFLNICQLFSWGQL